MTMGGCGDSVGSGSHILTEAGDRITTEGGDKIVKEDS